MQNHIPPLSAPMSCPLRLRPSAGYHATSRGDGAGGHICPTPTAGSAGRVWSGQGALQLVAVWSRWPSSAAALILAQRHRSDIFSGMTR